MIHYNIYATFVTLDFCLRHHYEVPESNYFLFMEFMIFCNINELQYGCNVDKF